MPRRLPKTGLALLTLVATVASSGRAQTAVPLRFAPTVGQRAHVLWWIETTATIRDAAAPMDSIVLEIRGQQSLTHQVLGVEGNARTLSVTLDSARPRMRAAGGVWNSVDLPGAGSSIRLQVDDRYRVLAVTPPEVDPPSTDVVRVLRAFATGFELAFPEQALAPGAPWTADVVFPVVKPAGLDNEPVVAGRFQEVYQVVARSTVTLDSLVARGPDSLAFLTVQGAFMPESVSDPTGETGRVTEIRGAFGGSLIWSTGWDAFVSGAVRTRATLSQVTRSTSEAGDSEVGPNSLVLIVDTTGRFQVRR